MGTLQVRLEVAGPARERFLPVDALVDPGSTYTVLPRGLLRDLGVSVDRRARFVLADGSEAELAPGCASREARSTRSWSSATTRCSAQ
jgi:predicted aspartyl protease